jgi:hypothetical protein
VGTRGYLAFVADGQEKGSYVHSDSYPARLGVAVLTWLRAERRRRRWPEIVAAIRALEPVPDRAPSPAEIDRYSQYALTPAQPGEADWYWLLRRAQGNPEAILACGLYVPAAASTFAPLAPWGYVIDVDSATLTVTRRGQRAAWWWLTRLPADAEFVAMLDGRGDRSCPE